MPLKCTSVEPVVRTTLGDVARFGVMFVARVNGFVDAPLAWRHIVRWWHNSVLANAQRNVDWHLGGRWLMQRPDANV